MYTLQTNKSDTLAVELAAGATSATLTSGNFTDDAFALLVVDYDVSAKLEVIKCTISGTSLTGITRAVDGTSDVVHSTNAKVTMAFVPSHYSDLIAEATQSSGAGWVAQGTTMTYQSATTMSSTDLLAKVSVGDKYKANQSIPLTSYWPMEDKDDDMGAATVANIGTPTYTAGKFANALTLDGATDALAVTDAAVFKPTGAFTLGMWLNTTASASTKFVYQSYSDNTNANGIKLYVAGNTGLVGFGVGNNAASDTSTVTGTTDITGGWHYVVVSSQGNFTKIFVDGVLNGSGYTVTPTYAATNYVRIGCQNNAATDASFFAGQIDDIFFINGHAVDQYWVAAKYAAATAQTTANITATYQGYVTTVADTLLTLTGGADYALYNGTITSPYYSKSSSPVGFPQWFNWTPTPTPGGSMTIGSVVIAESKFCIVDRLLKYLFTYSCTTGGSASTFVSYNIPVNRASVVDQSLSGLARIAAVGGQVFFNASNNTIVLTRYDGSNFAIGAQTHSVDGSYPI